MNHDHDTVSDAKVNRLLGDVEAASPAYDKPMDPKEKWTQCPNNGYDILVENGDFVGAFVHDDTYAPTSRARCSRAVACVNACADIPDPTSLRRQRDLLYQALERILKWADTTGPLAEGTADAIRDRIRSVIDCCTKP